MNKKLLIIPILFTFAISFGNNSSNANAKRIPFNDANWYRVDNNKVVKNNNAVTTNTKLNSNVSNPTITSKGGYYKSDSNKKQIVMFGVTFNDYASLNDSDTCGIYIYSDEGSTKKAEFSTTNISYVKAKEGRFYCIYGENETITENATYYAKGYVINNGTTYYSSLISAKGNYADEYILPTTSKITVTAGTGGTVSGGGNYSKGDSATVVATPSSDYSFEGWYENDTKISGANASYTFTISGPRTLTAKFSSAQQKYTLKLATNQGAYELDVPTILTGGGDYPSGTTVTIKATSAEPTFEFLGWYDGETKLSDNLEFTYKTGSSNKTLTAAFDNKQFESCTWKRISDKCTALEDGDIDENEFLSSFTIKNGGVPTVPTSMEDFIGVIRKEQGDVPLGKHKLASRVIGVQHGKEENKVGETDFIIENGAVTNKVATFTFDTCELVADDENGHSLAYQWNDTNSTDTSAEDYPNSSLRKVLCGSGNHDSPVYVSSYDALNDFSWDDNYTYKTEDDSILARMPEDFRKLLKTVKKTCRTGSNLKTVSDCSDKLFILSAAELGATVMGGNDEGLIYSFYDNGYEHRVKHPSCSDKISAPTDPNIIDGNQQYKGDIISYAGTCLGDRTETYIGGKGGYYWTRTAVSTLNEAYCVTPSGQIGGRISESFTTCYDHACAISVAFCM